MNILVRTARRDGARRAIAGAISVAAIAVVAVQPAVAQSAHDAAMERRVLGLEQELKILKNKIRADPEKAAKSADNPAKTVSSGHERVSVSISGQINRAVAVIGDGQQTGLRHVDNDNSSTRFRIKAKAKVSKDFSIGGRIEMEVQSNPSDSDSISATDQTTGNTAVVLRQARIEFASRSMGKITMGHGSVSVLHKPTGISFSYSQGQLYGPGATVGRGAGAGAPSYWYAKAGWQADLIPNVGRTYFAVDYAADDNLLHHTDKSTRPGSNPGPFCAAMRRAGDPPLAAKGRDGISDPA
ncbi:MAG: hypothetical protein ACTSXZ_01515 [Alphaproteobacteria bacterium]